MTSNAKRATGQVDPAPPDKVQEASEQSFPASDAPAWTDLHPGRPAPHERIEPERTPAPTRPARDR